MKKDNKNMKNNIPDLYPVVGISTFIAGILSLILDPIPRKRSILLYLIDSVLRLLVVMGSGSLAAIWLYSKGFQEGEIGAYSAAVGLIAEKLLLGIFKILNAFQHDPIGTIKKVKKVKKND